MQAYGSIDIRPYQLMCLVCRLGRRDKDPYEHEARLDKIAEEVRRDPGRPLSLRCNVDYAYTYQNPGREYDTPEGELFNDRRDLVVLQRMGLAPGDTRPARDALRSLVQAVQSTLDVCAFEEVSSASWQGCRFGHTGNYERGRDRMEEALLGPRPAAEKARAKSASCRAMAEADTLCIRPHHLMCMTCFHDGRVPDKLEPIQEDNLCEAITVCRERPDTPVRLVRGPCMICPPCSGYDPATSSCVASIAMCLRDQKKDLDALQRLGLEYGDVLPAGELLQRLYDRIPSTRPVCGYGDNVERSPEWRVCKSEARYTRGRAAGLGVPGVRVDAPPGQDGSAPEPAAGS